ncbi:MAG: hypothetical protein IPG68_00255 [Micrococcales bacterium]|nr:hypothetical protein [Micrococcales bacterium]
MYDSDRGIEELARRREGEHFGIEWLTDQLRVFVDLHPGDENAIERLATWLARDDEE